MADTAPPVPPPIEYRQVPSHHEQRRPSWPILTQQSRVPWAWVVLIQLPWFTGSIVENISANMMTYTLKKFVDVPYVITLITSFNLLFNMLVGATCNYLSDRIWTPVGRRRPFLLVASLVTVVFLFVIPLVGKLWLLVLLLCLYEMIRDVGSPMEALEKEVVPIPQRARGQAITQIVRLVAAMFFSAALFGRFTETYSLPGGYAFSGEMLIYWVGALTALGTALFYWLGVRELPPTEPPPPRPQGNLPAAVVTFAKAVFGSRHNWAVYMIGVSMMIFWTGLGSLGPLLYTEQWNLDMQTVGWMGTAGPLVAALTALLVARWADKVDRLRIVNVCAVLMIVHHVAFYLYGRSFPPGQAPSIWVLTGFSVFFQIIGNTGTMAAVAAQFDYVGSSHMGTIGAGFGILRTIVALVTNNAVGFWVTYYSRWTMPDGEQDYLAGYHYLIVLAALCTAAMMWFTKLARSGRVVKYGVLEQQERVAPA
jgi:MFS family permease